MDRPTVENWLRTLFLGQYSESFLDNGYDELEICKQIGEQDLDAIGVFNPTHRFKILEAVRKLREEGATAVYFTVEEVLRAGGGCRCSSERPARLASASSARYAATAAAPLRPCQLCAAGIGAAETASTCGSPAAEPRTPLPELKRLPSAKLRQMLQNKLVIDGIKLYNPPYSTKDGQMGYLNGLASRYADDVQTHYQDVLQQLDVLRLRAWQRLLEGDAAGAAARQLHGQQAQLPALPQQPPPPPQPQPPDITQSVQPIYLPGQYLPSSCLSDHDEDEIYGFGYGVYDARGGEPRRRTGSRSPVYGVPVNCASDSDGAAPLANGLLSEGRAHAHAHARHLAGHAAKKRGRLGRLFRTLKISRQRSFPKLGRSKGGRTLSGVSGPVLLPPTSLYAPPGSSYRPQMSPSRSLEEGVRMFKELERERLQQRDQQDSGNPLVLRDLRTGQLDDRSPAGGATGGAASLYGQSAGAAARSAWFDDATADSDAEEYLLDASLRDRLVPPSPARRRDHDDDDDDTTSAARAAGSPADAAGGQGARTPSDTASVRGAEAAGVRATAASDVASVRAVPTCSTVAGARGVEAAAAAAARLRPPSSMATLCDPRDPRYYQNIGYVVSAAAAEARRPPATVASAHVQPSALLAGVAALSLRTSPPQPAAAGR